MTRRVRIFAILAGVIGISAPAFGFGGHRWSAPTGTVVTWVPQVQRVPLASHHHRSNVVVGQTFLVTPTAPPAAKSGGGSTVFFMVSSDSTTSSNTGSGAVVYYITPTAATKTGSEGAVVTADATANVASHAMIVSFNEGKIVLPIPPGGPKPPAATPAVGATKADAIIATAKVIESVATAAAKMPADAQTKFAEAAKLLAEAAAKLPQ